MSKDRIAITVEEEYAKWLEGNTENKSAFINNLLEQYIDGTANAEDAIARYRREQLEAEKQRAESRLEQITEELQAVESDITTVEESREDAIQQALDKLSYHDITDQSDRLEYWAQQADMNSDTFAEELIDRMGDL